MGKNEEQDGRQKYREIIDKELEQSLDSINKFEHSHLGRITSNLDLEADGKKFTTFIKISILSLFDIQIRALLRF